MMQTHTEERGDNLWNNEQEGAGSRMQMTLCDARGKCAEATDEHALMDGVVIHHWELLLLSYQHFDSLGNPCLDTHSS